MTQPLQTAYIIALCLGTFPALSSYELGRTCKIPAATQKVR